MTHCETVLGTKLRFLLVDLPSWVPSTELRKRQVMSPTAHLPTVPTVLPLSVMDWSYDTEIANDLYQFTDNNGLCRRTLHIVSAQFTNKLICLLSFSLFALACTASLLASLMRLVRCPPGSLRGVGRKKSQRSSFFSFTRPCLQSPQAKGHLFLGFTPGSRPRVRGPAPLLLTKLGFLPGPVCGVREKTASDAVSHLALLLFLLSTVFAQASLHQTEPDKVLLYQLDSKNSPLPRCSGTNLGKAKWPQECQLPAVDNLAPPLPTARNCSGMSCLMTLCHTFGLVIEDFTVGTGFLIFGYGGFTHTFTSNCFAHTFPSLSARRGLSFSLMSCLHVACDAFANLTLKNGGLYFPFSTSNCAIRCHDLLHMSNLHGSSLFHRAFYHHWTYGGCVLQLANLIAKNGSWNLPFFASNSDIRCYTWLYSCFASGLNPLDRDFYHICNHLSVDCGGSIPPLEFWSWISSTLTLDGFHCPLRS